MVEEKSNPERQKNAGYRQWHRYHTTKMPRWAPLGYSPIGYAPMEIMYYPRIHPEDELLILEREKQLLKQDLERIEKRIEEIKKENKEV
jgi:hypothetical protein